jgi:hypothetical protein
VVLTVWGYLFLSLSGLAVGLFCWLSYCSLRDAAARPGKAAQKTTHDDFLARAARDITEAVSHGH